MEIFMKKIMVTFGLLTMLFAVNSFAQQLLVTDQYGRFLFDYKISELVENNGKKDFVIEYRSQPLMRANDDSIAEILSSDAKEKCQALLPEDDKSGKSKTRTKIIDSFIHSTSNHQFDGKFTCRHELVMD
jgi:hypothetical protein